MRRLCLFSAGFALAAAAYVAALLPAAWYVFAPLAALTAVLFALRRPLARRFAICALGLTVGLAWCLGYEALFLRPFSAQNGLTREVSAQVRALPQKTDYGFAVDVRLTLDGRSCPAILYYEDAETAPQPGDVVSCRAKLTAAQAKAARGNAYELSRGTSLTAAARETLRVAPGGPDVTLWPAKLAVRLRDAAGMAFSADTAGFLRALLLGDRSELSYAVRNALAIAGIYHAVAVSGMHVSILLGMILLLCGGNHRLAAALGIPAITFFIVMTGAPASAVRAGVMQTMVLLAPLLRRENDPPTTVCTALLCLLAQNPWAILDAGLQLSVTSTAGIVLFAGGMFRRLHAWKPLHRLLRRNTLPARIVRAMTTALSCTAASMVFALPVTAVRFGMLSLAAPVVNVACLWLLSAVFCGGVAALLLTLVYAPAGAALGWLLSWPVRLVLLLVRLTAKIPFAALYPENVYLIAAAAVLYALALYAALFPAKLRPLPALAVWFLLTAACFGLSALDYRLPAASFTVLDVGQGQCLVSRVGDDVTLIDCGGRADESGETAARYLLARGVYRVDRLVLTHFDADHCNGVRQLLRRVRVGMLYVPETQEGGALRAQLLLAAMDCGTQVCTVREDLTLPVLGGSVTIFAPVSGKADENDGLCVLAACEKYDILITGDLDEQAEYRLLSTHALPRVTALVAGHHGAKTSTSDALLLAVQPQAVFISAGADNRFGHPGLQTLARAASAGAAVYRTDLQGTITVRG